MLNRILKNPATWGLLIFGAFMYWLFRKTVKSISDAGGAVIGSVSAGAGAVKTGIENSAVAVADGLGINEKGGYDSSAINTDPYIIYNTARIAFARAKGYAPGTDNFKTPPGFPTYEAFNNLGVITF